MADYRLSRTVLKPIRFDWYQAGDLLPIDCTGFSCAVTETSLPWVPVATILDPLLGQCQLAAPTVPQAALLVEGQRYRARVVLRNALGEGIEEFEFKLVAV